MSPLSPAEAATLEVLLGNLLAWSLQLGILAWAAALLTQAFPLERPGPRLRLFQGLLTLGLALPLVQPWRATVAGVGWSLAFGPPAASPLATAPAPAPALEGTLPWAITVTLALLAGVALQLGRLGIGLARLRGVRLEARPTTAPAWLDALRSRVAPAARFVTSDQCGGPATFGVRRPTIVLPSGFDALPVEGQRAVALHELIHARRRDWLVLVGEELIRAVLFFHPAVHWLLGRIRLAREQSVDAEVVRSLGGRQAYLESLLAVARLSARAEAVPAAPFLRERHLRERVELLLKEVPMSQVRSLSSLVLTAGAALLGGTMAVAAFPMVSSPDATTLQASSPEPKGQQPADPTGEDKPFPAKKIVHVNPVYPKEAKEEGVEGLFILAATIDKEGRVSKARVVASVPSGEGLQAPAPEKWDTPEALLGDERLAAAAVEGVRQWRYEPVLDENGEPVEVEVTLVVNFKLS